MSLNGNQVLRRSARAGLLLHRQLDTSRSSFTSSAGAPTSNAPLMADKVIWLGQTGQQMGMEKKKEKKTFSSLALYSRARPAIFIGR